MRVSCASMRSPAPASHEDWAAKSTLPKTKYELPPPRADPSTCYGRGLAEQSIPGYKCLRARGPFTAEYIVSSGGALSCSRAQARGGCFRDSIGWSTFREWDPVHSRDDGSAVTPWRLAPSTESNGKQLPHAIGSRPQLQCPMFGGPHAQWWLWWGRWCPWCCYQTTAMCRVVAKECDCDGSHGDGGVRQSHGGAHLAVVDA